MQKNILITGNSSGLGLGLTEEFLAQGAKVYGLSRRGCPAAHDQLFDAKVDLGQLDQIEKPLSTLLSGVQTIDVAILNAGVLGGVSEMQHTSLENLKQVMDINVWSNKVILDCLLAANIKVDQIILISSGAAVRGGKGWGGYSISKAALNMLTELYAHEFPNTHLAALAPGIIDTAMQDFISGSENFDIAQFPGFAGLREAKGTDAMPDSATAAKNIITALPTMTQHPTGSFLDIRNF